MQLLEASLHEALTEACEIQKGPRTHVVIAANSGIQEARGTCWMPAFAGITRCCRPNRSIYRENPPRSPFTKGGGLKVHPFPKAAYATHLTPWVSRSPPLKKGD